MNNGLHFITLIEEAMSRPNPAQALQRAFERIISGRGLPSYRPDLRHFHRFMELVRVAAEEAHLLDWDSACTEEEAIPSSATGVAFRLERPDGTAEWVTLRPPDSRAVITDVSPGPYRLSMATGRLVWEGFLDNSDLTWEAARPGEPFPLAADSDEHVPAPTQEVLLFSGDMCLRVQAGIEKGRLEISRPEALQ